MIQGKVRTEKEYRALPLDSSSSLKEFSLDKKKYYKKYVKNERVEDDEQSKAAVVGQIVETLLFEKDKFDDRFYMSSAVSAPTGNMLIFVESLYKHTSTTDLTFEECLKEAYKDSGYKLSFEKVLERFVDNDPEIYFKEIRDVRSKGLTVVTIEDVTNAEKTVDELKNNEFTGPILRLVSSDRYQILVQQQVEKFEIDGLPLKAMLDLIIIDHEKKVIQPYDLKCVWSVEGFYKEYYLYRRAYIQAFLYNYACEELGKLLDLEDYRVENLKFIVCDSINYYNPLIYTLNTDDMQDAYNGFVHKGEKYPGVKTIIADLKWAKENDKWNISRSNYLNNGFVNIKG